MKKKIIEYLESTNRAGVGALIEHMEKSGFFTAPCSGKYHLCCEGGLAEHTLNVIDAALKIGKTLLEDDFDQYRNSIIIAAALHDLGKMGDHGKANYVINMIKDGRPTKADPEQKYKQSEAEPYKTNSDLLYLDHEVRSISIANRFLLMTEDEEWAILMHNGMYGNFRYSIQGKETPLYMILHWADMWASRVMEKED